MPYPTTARGLRCCFRIFNMAVARADLVGSTSTFTLCIQYQEMWETRGMIFYVLAIEIRKEIWSQRVRCVGSLVLMLKVSSDRSCCWTVSTVRSPWHSFIWLFWFPILSTAFIKPRSRRLGGFLLCLRFIFLNRAAVGWAVSCSAFGLFFFKPRSRRLGGFLLCLRFFFFVLSVTISKPPRMMSSSANCRPFLSSFGHIPPQEHFVKLPN